jgi:hypothetical protein
MLQNKRASMALGVTLVGMKVLALSMVLVSLYFQYKAYYDLTKLVYKNGRKKRGGKGRSQPTSGGEVEVQSVIHGGDKEDDGGGGRPKKAVVTPLPVSQTISGQSGPDDERRRSKSPFEVLEKALKRACSPRGDMSKSLLEEDSSAAGQTYDL